jgi:mannan endo-1,4-beta-mannosidase
MVSEQDTNMSTRDLFCLACRLYHRLVISCDQSEMTILRRVIQFVLRIHSWSGGETTMQEKAIQTISKWRFLPAGLIVVAIASIASNGTSAAQNVHNNEFVRRNGTRLTLAGKDFRYSGSNIEWLGIEAYGPDDAQGPRYPSHAEVDDVLDTAAMMGARVVRSQTMGDSVGCDLCLEPSAGVFNPAAFKTVDYAIKAAHDRGIRLIITLVGDCANCVAGGEGEYVAWKGRKNPSEFFTDPAVISAFEGHIAALLNHKNVYTGIAYKDDPTILAWEDCNVCGLMALSQFAHDPEPYLQWINTIGNFVKSIDKNHLYEDNSGFFLFDPRALDARSVDIDTAEYYPHWDKLFGFGQKTTAATFIKHAAMVTSKDNVYVVNEFGWDATDWPTREDLEKVLKTLESDPNIRGDDFWALQAHADKFGWQPISAPANSASYAKWGETGQWWSMFYGGVRTLTNTAQDMQARAELLRTHAYVMAGLPVPAYPVPAAPIITFKGIGLLGWHGSAGAVVYTVQRRADDSAKWETVCDRCATDADAPWIDKEAATFPLAILFSTRYRVIAYNADGVASTPSAER